VFGQCLDSLLRSAAGIAGVVVERCRSLIIDTLGTFKSVLAIWRAFFLVCVGRLGF
jgi:hypothetical protein